MKIREFLAKATHIEALWVSTDLKHWNTNQGKGLQLMTREQILNGTPSGVAEQEASKKETPKVETNQIKKSNKKK